MSQVDTKQLTKLSTEEIKSATPEQLDKLTKSSSFRQATALLLAGTINLPTWESHLKHQLSTSVDIPYVGEATERGIFDSAIQTLGTVLQGLLTGGSGQMDQVTENDEFRKATLDLLKGTMTVPEWIDVAAKVLNAILDVPYLPEVGEDIAFERGLSLLAKALHGLFTGGSSDKASSSKSSGKSSESSGKSSSKK